MSRNAVVPEEFAKKFATEKETPYTRWVRSEGLDIVPAHFVPNLRTLALNPWARRGGAGVVLNHDASRTSNDCYVCEIPAGGKLAPQRQLFEEMIYVLAGRGSTTVWNDAGNRVTFEWKAGSLFAIPLNAWHQHFNGAGRESARYVAVTNSPAVINLYEDVDFVFNTKYDFKGRFSGEPDYFSNKGEQRGLLLDTNFVADAVNLPLISAKERGARLDEQPHLAVPRGDLQEGARPRPGRPRHHAHRRRLQPDVARGRRAAAIRLAGRGHDRSAEHVVPPAFQHRRNARALPRVQARGDLDPQPAGRAQGLDQPPRRRRPDRLRRRGPLDPPLLLRRAREARHEAEDGRSVQRRAGRAPAPGAGVRPVARPGILRHNSRRRLFGQEF